MSEALNFWVALSLIFGTWGIAWAIVWRFDVPGWALTPILLFGYSGAIAALFIVQ